MLHINPILHGLLLHGILGGGRELVVEFEEQKYLVGVVGLTLNLFNHKLE